ncbi:hypothetical protein KOI35_09475 [Actinoplanes bogorensis]|uniref:DUF1801 domain-containing protein n=1 Tax=Paractinoplanes bogorensis TaxID=1610840 RepID=A0ABS5YJY8_9ACTN|nr:hypothetical protein [Actinoplanes bogorensis]MBU2663737.1 hypothetical protein [Actinoplanes bogorensis]
MADDEIRARMGPLEVKSIVGGGLEDKRWTRAIESMHGPLTEFPGISDVPFNVTVTFLVPGEVWGPKFSGIRIGTFLGDYRSLVVQVALPAHPENDARAELLDLVDAAIARAEGWGRRKKLLDGGLAEARKAADRLRKSE